MATTEKIYAIWLPARGNPGCQSAKLTLGQDGKGKELGSHGWWRNERAEEAAEIQMGHIEMQAQHDHGITHVIDLDGYTTDLQTGG